MRHCLVKYYKSAAQLRVYRGVPNHSTVPLRSFQVTRLYTRRTITIFLITTTQHSDTKHLIVTSQYGRFWSCGSAAGHQSPVGDPLNAEAGSCQHQPRLHRHLQRSDRNYVPFYRVYSSQYCCGQE